MDDRLKAMLRHKAEEMRLEPDMPAGIGARSRRRRFVNVAVAAAVVGAVGFGSFTGFRFALEQSGGPRLVTPAAPEERGVPSIFPQPHLVPELQGDADSGDAAEWRDPQYVAMRFAMNVMGWARHEFEMNAPMSTPDRITIWNPTLTVVGTDHIETILHLQRYQGREDGIVMVTAARSPAIEIDTPQPWDPIRPGQTIQVQGRLGFIHEGGGLLTEISTVPGGTHSGKSIGQVPEFSFRMEAARDRAVAISFTMYDAEGTDVARTEFRMQGLDEVASTQPEAGPTPGPTPTGDDATPAAVPVELVNASTQLGVPAYLASLLEHQGRGAHHGGYRVTGSTETEGSEVTVILLRVGFEDEAARIERLFFPGADLRVDELGGTAPLRIVVGEDFALRHEQAVEAFTFVGEFGAARRDADRADLFLGTEAASYYHAGENDGGSLYGYAKGCPYEVQIAEDPESAVVTAGEVDEFLLFFCRNHADSWTETVRVAPVNGELRIVEASLTTVTVG